MGSTPEEIASSWREQMRRGYLNLAILFVLTKGPLHGYEMMKRISEWTLGMITPTAGGLYPTLNRLEREGLIRGEWKLKERRKVYRITEKGREVFRKAVERHFKLASSIRRWFFKELADLKLVEEIDVPSVMEPAIRVLLLKEDASREERIEALENLRERFETLSLLLSKMTEQIRLRIEELKSSQRSRP
ncbi:MAG: PadR family transcriptional regulator [Candidatus Bathyarchaeota archaeon B26-1]|nr:MAG: PadR family transcriptional regulator [Candidatus Bathyarchaeota archaeon B26-1]